MGGPNFGQLPINRPHAPVNDMLRDGMHQTADHAGVAPYRPNSLDGGCPFTTTTADGAFLEVPSTVEGRKVREHPASFSDHFSQVTLFWRSMTPVEQDHIVAAYIFELDKCYQQAVRERQVQCLANIDADLCARVAEGLGLPAPDPDVPPQTVTPSPALSQLGKVWPVDGRVLGLVVDDSTDMRTVQSLRHAADTAGMVLLLVAPRGGGELTAEDGPVPIQRSLLTARSVEFDAVLLAAAPGPQTPHSVDAKAVGDVAADAVDPRLTLLVAETFRHAKAIGAWGAGTAVLDAAGVHGPGVVRGHDPEEVLAQVRDLVTGHRVWDRFPTTSTKADS